MRRLRGKGKVARKLARNGTVAARTGIEMKKSRHVTGMSRTGYVTVVFLVTIISLLHFCVALLPIWQIDSVKMRIEPVEKGVCSWNVSFCVRKAEHTMGKSQDRCVAFRYELVSDDTLLYQ